MFDRVRLLIFFLEYKNHIKYVYCHAIQKIPESVAFKAIAVVMSFR